jgi:hypothetical protein
MHFLYLTNDSDPLSGLINDFEEFKVAWCAQDGRMLYSFCSKMRSRLILLLNSVGF